MLEEEQALENISELLTHEKIARDIKKCCKKRNQWKNNLLKLSEALAEINGGVSLTNLPEYEKQQISAASLLLNEIAITLGNCPSNFIDDVFPNLSDKNSLESITTFMGNEPESEYPKYQTAITEINQLAQTYIRLHTEALEIMAKFGVKLMDIVEALEATAEQD
jgi:hypothetical protein